MGPKWGKVAVHDIFVRRLIQELDEYIDNIVFSDVEGKRDHKLTHDSDKLLFKITTRFIDSSSGINKNSLKEELGWGWERLNRNLEALDAEGFLIIDGPLYYPSITYILGSKSSDKVVEVAIYTLTEMMIRIRENQRGGMEAIKRKERLEELLSKLNKIENKLKDNAQ